MFGCSVTIYHWELSMSTLHFGMFWTTCGISLITINYFPRLVFLWHQMCRTIYLNYCRQDCACNSNNTNIWFKDLQDDLRLYMALCQTLL